MTTTYPSNLLQLDEALQIIGDLCRDEASLSQVLKNKACARIMVLFDAYLQFIRSGDGFLSLLDDLFGYGGDSPGPDPGIT